MTASKPKARSVSDFRAAHDRNVIVPNKIRAAIAAMAAIDKEHWEYESDFVKLAGISQTDLGQFRDQFAPNVVETPKMHNRSGRRVWFATAKAAADAFKE